MKKEINELKFESKSGILRIKFENDLIKMDLPKRIPEKAELPKTIYESLSIKPIDVYKSRDYVLVYNNENEIKEIKIDRALFDQIDLGPGGVCITARSREFDFVSRFFTPQSTILEDPVTGSVHCSLIPLWSEKLGKVKMIAKQVSERSGILYCENGNEDRVYVAGNACLYGKGIIKIEG